MSNDFLVKNKMAQYLLRQADIKELQAEQVRLKEELEPYLSAAPTNARGSHVIEFAEPLELDGKRYKSLQKVRKESKVLNEERALAFLTSDQAFECALVTVQHVDQDALWDLYVNDFITEEELNSLFDITETFAFSPTKE